MADSKLKPSTPQVVSRAFVLAVVLISVSSYLVSLAVGLVLFFSTADGLHTASRVIRGIPLDFFAGAYSPTIPLRTSIGALFTGIWAVFVICMFFAWRSRRGFLTSIRESISESLSFARTSYLYLMPVIATALFASTVLIEEFQATQGVQTGNLNFPPKTSPYFILINLAFAPINEEFAFRMTTIGIPLGIALVFLYWSDPKISGIIKKIRLVVVALLSPERAKVEMGYKNVHSNGLFKGISVPEWILILVTSLYFGLAHLLAGGGWEIGKVSTAFLAGFMLAIVYVTYGAYASILLHWYFNYYFTVLDMASSTYAGSFQLISNLIEVGNLVAGSVIVVVFLVVAAVQVSKHLTSRVAQM
jgi:membrane protease YdiL (CAAX protease family)